jgi:predicted metalloprotease
VPGAPRPQTTSTRGRRARRAALAGLLVLAAGCTVAVDSRGAPEAPPPESRQQDESDAVDSVNAYWQRHFAELSPDPYVPPQVAGGYVGEDGPVCAGQPSVPGNAFYCPAGDFLAWDERLMDAGYQQIGDAWVYMIIAHEWGHAIQARLRRGQVSVAAELQADCLAGAALQGAVDDGLLYLEPGDTDEVASTLVAVADDFPWSDTRSHGNAEERIDAFNAGTAGGLRGCF